MKFTIITEDEFEANCLLKAKQMAIQINSLYDEVLRKYVKYIELTDEQQKIVDLICDEVMDHFDELRIEEI